MLLKKSCLALATLLAMTQIFASEEPLYSPDQQTIETQNIRIAEAFIDAFYSFDANQLLHYLTEADDTAISILSYQGWAEGGNYKVQRRSACKPESAIISCSITVQDDPVIALHTGFNVTDTFHLTFKDGHIQSIETSSDDQPIYFEARKWVEENMPEVMAGPYSKQANTPEDCARAMTTGYKRFYESKG
jgi:hypothetical protein